MNFPEIGTAHAPGIEISKLFWMRFPGFANNRFHKILHQKKRFKHEKQRHLVAKIKFRIFLVETPGPFRNFATVFGRCNNPVKSPFFGISSPSYTENQQQE